MTRNFNALTIRMYKVKVEQLTSDPLSLWVFIECWWEARDRTFYAHRDVVCYRLLFSVLEKIKSLCSWFQLVSKLEPRNVASISCTEPRCNLIVDPSCEGPPKGLNYCLNWNNDRKREIIQFFVTTYDCQWLLKLE